MDCKANCGLCRLLIFMAVAKCAFGDTTLSCPPWTFPSNQSTGEYQCECGDSLNGVVKCDPTTLERSILSCHCMTYSETYNETVVGYCIFNCLFFDTPHWNVNSSQVDELREETCNLHGLHRTGQMCGNCQHNYAPAVYSYHSACVNCTDHKYNSLKYIGIVFLPLTALYIIVVLFRISITTGAMNTYVMASQIIGAPIQLRLLTLGATNQVSSILLNIFSSFFMIWNLDIFRSLYKPFCLHPKASTLHILALEYAIAVYPMLLVIITYVVADLHERFIVVVRLWRPFYRVFAWFRKEWNIRSSLIDAFATFIVLSYVKILNTSFDLLTPVALYGVHGNRISQLYLYYDGTVEYFGKEHLPFAILALLMFLVFNLFPLILLCLYPCRCFQMCLNGLPNSVQIVLKTFMDSFQGCFRTKPYDCRYFAGIYLGFRIVNLALFSLTTSPLYYAIGGVLALSMSVVIGIVRPYESQTYVALDVIFTAMFAMIGLGALSLGYSRLLDPRHVIHSWYRYTYPVLLAVPMYGFGLLVYKILPKKVLRSLKNCVLKCCRCTKDDEDEVPYRLSHIDEYTPLVSVMN